MNDLVDQFESHIRRIPTKSAIIDLSLTQYYRTPVLISS